MSIRYSVATCMAAVLVASATISAAVQDAHEMRVGSTVNITSCIIPSLDDDDEFVLTNITDVPVHPAQAGKVVYWISDVNKLRPYVGRRIQFDATIKDVDRREIEVKLLNGESNGNGNGHNSHAALIEIEGPGNQVKTAPENAGLSAAGQTVAERAVPTTLVKLKLHDNIRSVAGSCDARTAR